MIAVTGGMVVQWWPLSTHSKKILGLNLPADFGLSVCVVCFLCVCVGFL